MKIAIVLAAAATAFSMKALAICKRENKRAEK